MNEQTLFTETLEQDPSERSAFLDQACGEDIELRKRVEHLLEIHENVGGFLESPPPGLEALLKADFKISEQPGTEIGPYKLLQQIGEGGMGVVYMAEQTESVSRKVALKIIKPGMDTRQVIARFEAERQALAMMDHPNIAKVLDTGTTDSGRPYFVMELVKGLPITEYCDRQKLDIRQRLHLFVSACQAIQHAHQKGIIHRDIKPSNVMVALYDERPVPKIIDFGVAKAIEQRLTEKTVFTQFGQIVGTFEYMSPEQAQLNQLDVDTRSDVYSLGVLLYELLTGETPIDAKRLRSAAFDEMLRIVREEDPLRPSARLSTSDTAPENAANRQVEPKRLSSLVQGELDWIVMKALEKDRTRRYETAAALGDDIENYLNDEPVEACPPSNIYMIGKFARRNKGWLSTAAAVLLTVIAGLTISTILIAKERDAAEAAASHAKELAQREANATERAERQFRAARDAVDRMLTTAANDLVNVPHSTEVRQKLLEDALEFYEGFLEQKSTDPVIRYETAQAWRRVGRIRGALSHRAEAREAFRESIELLQSLVDEFPQEATYKADLATCIFGLNSVGKFWDYEPALRANQKYLALSEELVAEHPANPKFRKMVAFGHRVLGDVLRYEGNLSEAIPHYRKALSIWQQIQNDFPQLPVEINTLANIRGSFGKALLETNELAEAEQQFHLVLEQRVELVNKHPKSRLHRYRIVTKQGRHGKVAQSPRAKRRSRRSSFGRRSRSPNN